MIRYNLLIALRSLSRFQFHSLSNVISLALGISCCFFTMLYLNHELGYDRFHQDVDRIFRVTSILKSQSDGEEFHQATTKHSVGSLLKQEFGEIEQLTRARNMGDMILRYEDKSFMEDGFFYVDDSIFEVFSYEAIKSDLHHALARPNTVVITDRIATKYFGAEDPIGKMLNVWPKYGRLSDYEITAVIKTPRSDTHFQFDFLASMKSLRLKRKINENRFHTYIKVRSGTSPKILEEHLIDFVARHSFTGNRYKYTLRLQPLTGIHLGPNLIHQLEDTVDARTLYLLAAVAMLILALAMTNYINSSVVQYARRLKEIGLKKVLGSTTGQLAREFLIEALIFSLVSFGLTIVFTEIGMPAFRNFTGVYTINTGKTVVLLFFLTVVVALIAGCFPALYLPRVHTTNALRGQFTGKTNMLSVVRVLMIFQLVISMGSGICIMAVYNQLGFLKSKPLGFDADALVTFRNIFQVRVLKHEFLTDSRILGATVSSAVPGIPITEIAEYSFIPEGSGQRIALHTIHVDEEFADIYGLKLINGRWFSKDRPSDQTGAYIINESAAELLGYGQRAIGKKLVVASYPQIRDDNSQIIGIVKDFHFESLYSVIRPLVIAPTVKLYGGELYQCITVKIDTSDIEGSILYLKEKNSLLAPGKPFDFKFLQSVFEGFYRNEKKLIGVLALLCLIAVYLSFTGAFSLAIYTVRTRQKEIAIRRVLGASETSIIVLLIRNFLPSWAWGCAISIPLSYILLDEWLRDFPYRAEINITTVVLPLLLMLSLLAVICYQKGRNATRRTLTMTISQG